MAASSAAEEPLWRRVAQAVLDGLLPPRCLGCGLSVPEQGTLCEQCWSGLRFVAAPLCRHCGTPLPESAQPDPLCASCATAPPPFDRARAALVYDDGCRRMILRYKHGDRIEAVPTFTRWLAQAGQAVLADADLLVPVPLHRWRLLKRGYNQSALLARGLARRTGKAALVDGLVRTRATASQQGLSASARKRNVTSAVFAPHPWHKARLAGRRIVLIDDVLTTGATINACARVLKKAGAEAVDVLTLARTDRAARLD